MKTPDTAAHRPATSAATSDYLLAVAIAAIVGLWVYTRTSPSPNDQDHVHPPGANGGVIISMGRDRYHAEALVEQSGIMRLLMLGSSTTEVIDVDRQELLAYIAHGDGDVSRLTLAADPQPGDPPGRTSQFAAQLPTELIGKPIQVTIAAVRIDAARYRFGFAWPNESHLTSHQRAMPAKVTDAAERRLYLEPGGLYTAADIAANGNVTASEKLAGFRAQHDFNPRPGDALCPITQTKANPDCHWIIGGHRYTFCCPPCIDEFLELAKQSPEQIQPPSAYSQTASE